MKLILVRHAEAVDLGEAGIATDFDRPLTDLGRNQASALAEALAGFNLLPDVVYTSPFVRAVQTSEPIAAALTPGVSAMPLDFLRLEEMRPRKLAKVLNDAGHPTVILVGHMPDMAQLAGWLLGCGPTAVAFDKAAAASIACGNSAEKGRGELRWLSTPDWYLPAVTSP